MRDAEQVAPQRVEIDLVAQPGGEGVDGALGVVAGAGEAAIDRILDPPAQRTEQRNDRERRPGDGEVRRSGERTQQRGECQDREDVCRENPAEVAPYTMVRLTSRSMSYRR